MSTFLNRRVLVLNQSYEPIMVLGAKRAIILVLSKKVEAIENYREIIHSSFLSLPLPSVIKLREYLGNIIFYEKIPIIKTIKTIIYPDPTVVITKLVSI